MMARVRRRFTYCSRNNCAAGSLSGADELRTQLKSAQDEVERLKADYYLVSKLVVRHNEADEVAKMLKTKDEQALKGGK